MTDVERPALDVVAAELQILSHDAFATIPVVSPSPLQGDLRAITALLPPGTIAPDIDTLGEEGVVLTWQAENEGVRLDILADGSGLVSILVTDHDGTPELCAVSLGDPAAIVERMARPLPIALLLGVPIRRPMPVNLLSKSGRQRETCRTDRA